MCSLSVTLSASSFLAAWLPRWLPCPSLCASVLSRVTIGPYRCLSLHVSCVSARGNVEGLFFEVVIENCLYVCNRLPRPITLRFLPQDCGGLPRQQQQQQQQQQQMLTFDSFIPQPPTEIQIEAGEEVSLAADPAHITVYFGGRVSRPVEVDYFMPGVRRKATGQVHVYCNTGIPIEVSTSLFLFMLNRLWLFLRMHVYMVIQPVSMYVLRVYLYIYIFYTYIYGYAFLSLSLRRQCSG